MLCRARAFNVANRRPYAAAQAQANLARDLAMAANANEQARRYLALVQEGIVTQEQYDQLKATADALSASVASDRAALESARLQLTYCYIRADDRPDRGPGCACRKYCQGQRYTVTDHYQSNFAALRHLFLP